MATRFVRVDLTDAARDFRPIAVEPGVPLLDRSNANAKILFRWLGGMVAEPVWEGDSVNFFVRDDHGGRLEEVICQTATADDLEASLKEDVATLRDRINKANPETSTERTLHKTVRRCFEELTEDPHRTDLDDYFFKYQDVQGRWRLVWCWGYQRVDQEPAPAVVCTDPECSLLFVRRPGQSPKCPSCEALLASRTTKRTAWRRPALVGLLLLLLAAALLYWWMHPSRLIATPGMYTGPVGSRVEFKIERAGLIPFLKKDVTRQTVGVVLNPAVAALDQSAVTATITGQGSTLVRFHLGNLKPVDVTLVAGPPRNPQRILIEPGSIELAIGTTARPKVIGEYEDGSRADLTEAAEWAAEDDKIVYVFDGLLEGLAEGDTTVGVRYRASPDNEYLSAQATVNVADLDFKSLKVAIDPLPVGVGRASDLDIVAVTPENKEYSVLESSLLSTRVEPQYVAEVEGRRIKGKTVGSGKMAVTFNDDLTGGIAFDVVLGPGLEELVVAPESLQMVPDEIVSLSILSPSTAPIDVTSPDQSVVEVAPQHRLIARGEGTATVVVTQGSEKREVNVTVVDGEFRSIAIDPPRPVVPVDDTLGVRVVGKIEAAGTTRDGEIAPDLLTCQKRPSPRYVGFDARSMELNGVTPTDPSSPQTLAFSFRGHEASAPVEVVVAPLRLELSPPGPLDVPLGQQVRLSGWATYSGGRRVQVPAHRLEFSSKAPSGPVEGLELRGDRVAALKPGAGPLEVLATYFGRESKPVVCNSVEAGPVTLRLEVDRTLRLAGETGRVTISGTDPKGDVDLVPELAVFESSEPGVLAIDEKTGGFRALTPGEAIITGKHPASKDSASLKLDVYDPAKARLVFEPSAVKVAVDEVARLNLFIEVQDGGKTHRATLEGPGVGYAMTQPQAVRWSPPTIVGVSPTAPFELSASYYPVLSSTATAQIEVVPAVAPQNIRIVPSAATLASGQTVSLKVEQQLPGAADQWKEVRPGAVAWKVPPGLIWAPAEGGLRPAATVPEAPPREFELQANFGGKQATGLITTKDKGPDPNQSGVQVVLVREPPGQYLPVGGQQRYAIVVEKEGVQEPAAEITWPEDFENDYVTWQAPVLTAKRGGYRQWFRAEVSGRPVLFHTSTYEPARFDRAPPREDQPVAVKILSDQGPLVRFPVGAEFDDFRVEAEYPDGFTQMVTKKATLRTAEPPDSAPLSASEGRLVGVRPGRTQIHAEFKGVKSQQPLQAEVVAGVDIDQIRIAPAPVTIRPRESYALQAHGYKDGKSIGDITGIANITWNSANPQIAQVSGPTVTGVTVGQTAITAQMGAIASAPTEVNVVDSLAAALAADPKEVMIRVGEGVRIGTDLAVYRGEMDMSRQCTVTPQIPGIVEYRSDTHSLVGKVPGTSDVTFTHGEEMTTVRVRVVPGVGPIDGQVVVEPSVGNLAVGQALDLRVLVVTPEGDRIDRTASAVFSSSAPDSVAIQGNLACALAAGTAEITASLPGTEQTGTASVNVNEEPITELIVDPPQMVMSTGDVARLRIMGRAASGTHLMFPQSDLTVTAAGQNPEAIQIVGASDVSAVRPGEAAAAVSWRGQVNRLVPIQVGDDVLTDLQIEPAVATISPGQEITYRVTGLRGGVRRVLGKADGVELFVSSQDVARVAENELAVQAARPGQTAVVARFGPQQAEAALNVVEGGEVAVGGPAGEVVGGFGGYDVVGGYTGDRRYWDPHLGRWVGRRWVDDDWVYGYRGDDGGWVAIDRNDVIVGNPGVVYPTALASAAGLRFVPETMVLSPNSPPTAVRVVEVLADGRYGREVTADPNLELTQPPSVVRVEKTAAGPLLRPIGQGQTTIGAKLGTLTADPLLVSVGQAAPGGARLVVAPDPLRVYVGEMGAFGSVAIDPGGGQLPFEVDYKITPAAGQGIVQSAGDKMVRGVAGGVAQVVVSAVDPTGVYQGLSATATVEVTGASPIWIQPPAIDLVVGQATPPIAVMTQGQRGAPYQVPAEVQSMDANVLAPDPRLPGRFVARSLGQTQIRAVYRGQEALAQVTVSGERFMQVNETFIPAEQDFGVTLEVLAAEAEGPLQYRVYAAGQPPAENWVDAELVGQFRRVTLQSPRMRYGPRGAPYTLVIEARDPSGTAVQKYPFTFRLKPTLERTDQPRAVPEFQDRFE